MKKTHQINIGGMVFHIDEDAYERLESYLAALRQKFSKADEGEEIIEDIELRMAELFQARVKAFKQVITLHDVESVITILGQPEDFSEEEEEEKEEEPKKGGERKSEDATRRLYRDPDRAILGGVCVGMAAYFKVDPALVRVIFVILLVISVFTFTLVYLVLWVLIPRASTTAQKLEMKGEKVTVENIEKTIKEEYEKVKENFKKFRKSKEYSRTKEVTGEVAQGIGEVFRVIIRLVFILIGFAFVVAGIVVILALLGFITFKIAIFSGLFGLDIFPLNDFLALFIDYGNIQLFKIGLVLLVCIPVLGLIIGGVRLILGVHSKNKALGTTGFILWFLGLIVVITLLFIEGQDLTHKAQVTQTYFIDYKPKTTLYLKNDNTMYTVTNLDETIFDKSSDYVIQMDTEEKLFIRPELDILQGKGDKVELIIRTMARGEDREEAERNAEKVNYHFTVQKNQVILPPYFTIQQDEKYRLQDMDIVLKVPEGTRVNISDELKYILDDIARPYNISRWELYNTDAVMTEKGLTLAEE